MSEKSLFKLVNDAMGNNENNKILVGYTVSSYSGVLSALEKAAQKVAEAKAGVGGAVDGDNRTITTTRYSILSQMGLDGTDDGTGFVIGQYQGVCVFKDYMSFVVDCTKDDGKKFTMLVPVSKNSNDTHINNGVGCISGNPIFPANTVKDKEYYRGLDGDSAEFKIGVGLSIGNFALKFFQKFFPNIEWTEQKLKSIAAKEALFAEVVLPTGKGSNAKVLHAMVTVDVVDMQGMPFQVHIPNPLILLNDYKSIGTVRIKFNSKSTPVGQDKVVNPLASKRYYHKDAKIMEFTPDYIKNFTKDSEQGGICEYEGTSLCSGNTEVKGRVRLYFDKERKDSVSSILGMIPTEYEKEMFTGHVSDDQIIKNETVVSGTAAGAIGLGAAAQGLKTDSAFYHEGQVDWAKFRQKHPKLPAGHEDIIESVARQFNINTRMWMTQMGLETGWFTSKNFKTRRNPGGISAGSNYKGGETYTLDYLGGVRAKRAVEVRGEGYGHYWIFETYEDGYRAMAYLLVNSKRYGLAKFGAQTVYEHYTNMYNGGYCDLREAVCQQYNDKLMNQYASIC